MPLLDCYTPEMSLLSMALIMVLLQQAPPAVPQERIDQARHLAQGGEFESAEREFRSLLAYEPKDPVLNYYLGMTLFKQEHYPAASVYLERAIDLEASFPEPFLWLARTFLQLNEPERAGKIVQSGLAQFPRHKELLELQKALEGENAKP